MVKTEAGDLGDFSFLAIDKVRANTIAKSLDVALRVICASREPSNRVLLCIFDPQSGLVSLAAVRCVITFGLGVSRMRKDHALQFGLFEPISEEVALEFPVFHRRRDVTSVPDLNQTPAGCFWYAQRQKGKLPASQHW